MAVRWFSGGCNSCLTGCNTGYCCSFRRCNYSCNCRVDFGIGNCLGSRGTGGTSDSFDRLDTWGWSSKLGRLDCTDRSGNYSGSWDQSRTFLMPWLGQNHNTVANILVANHRLKLRTALDATPLTGRLNWSCPLEP